MPATRVMQRRVTPKLSLWEGVTATLEAWRDAVLERTVCCGVDPAQLEAMESKRSLMLTTKESSVFSLSSRSLYPEQESEWSETDSEESDLDVGLFDSRLSSPVSGAEDLTFTGFDWSRTVSGEQISFAESDCEDEEEFTQGVRPQALATLAAPPLQLECEESTVGSILDEVADVPDMERRAYFNCVLAELLMSLHQPNRWISRGPSRRQELQWLGLGHQTPPRRTRHQSTRWQF
ncbi:hypothetical protein Poli38472_004512 [Pythium oligandrum]|uniref:Uncharacterized protein n=1 Tax=Pythium oligandrum TaxID=41045 RepID=A0A8K1FI71_PYTOL|nr:hypothetical protein Poli38472_004512 [Pythium oligandrum]|eukprot:TMW59443.1 hypothetical protein Poli38472_004512 [Pythium oligandrum]